MCPSCLGHEVAVVRMPMPCCLVYAYASCQSSPASSHHSPRHVSFLNRHLPRNLPRACLALCLPCALRAVAVCLQVAYVMMACRRHRYRYHTDGHIASFDCLTFAWCSYGDVLLSASVSCRLAISVGVLRHIAIMVSSCCMLQAFAACLLYALSVSSLRLPCVPSAACLPCVACPMPCLPSRIASWRLGGGRCITG